MAVYPLLSLVAGGGRRAARAAVVPDRAVRRPRLLDRHRHRVRLHDPVDGWMSKTSDPIVIYDPAALSGIRFPWDIPVEEFVYAFALVTLTMLLWDRAARR